MTHDQKWHLQKYFFNELKIRDIDPRHLKKIWGICQAGKRRCDVKGCKNVVRTKGEGWTDTGFWALCAHHCKLANRGDSAPKMKKKAKKKEAKRRK